MSGVTSEPEKAICEFIWNGFDANATHIELNYSANELGGITVFSISDDGDGISKKTLSSTFGRYQDSVKRRTPQRGLQVKGHRGKGRYAFNCFSTRAVWDTVCKEDDQLLRHSISINAGDNAHYEEYIDDTRPTLTLRADTGTCVSFDDVTLMETFFESEGFLNYLKREFAVFLMLNKRAGKNIYINGVVLDYQSIIAETETKQLQIVDERSPDSLYEFELMFVRWNEKTKESYRFYFLDNTGNERHEMTSSFNKKDSEFHHSVYITSSYFDRFIPPAVSKTKDHYEGTNVVQGELAFIETKDDKTEKDEVFKCLVGNLKDWIKAKEKAYISDVGGEKLWAQFEANGVVSLPANDYEKSLFEDLKQTVKAIYSVQPKVFANTQKEQSTALLGCLKLLLQTDKREDFLAIMDGVVKMTDKERHRLAEVLKVTELSNITNTIDLLMERHKVVSAIKAMIFDRGLKVYEVHDIQPMISNAFWLFGEEYNIVTEAEPDFQQALERYLGMLHQGTKGNGKSGLSATKIEHPDVNKEMDIFAFRQTKDSRRIENIVIELKRPSVKLGEAELNQVKKYMRLIYSQPQFNSANAKWTFILVGNELDKSGTITHEYETNRNWGKKDLVLHVKNETQDYEIFVKTWSTVFDDFEMRHDFLLKKLQIKRDLLSAKYTTKQDLHDIVKKA